MIGKQRLALGVFGLVGLVTVAGCGGGGGTSTLSAKEVVAKAQPATVQLFGTEGSDVVGGTGFVVNAQQGLVLTNAHVISGVTALKARTDDGQEVPAQILGKAPCDDVAVVKLTSIPTGLQSLPLGDSSKVADQDPVVALGYPESFQDPATAKVTTTSGNVQSANIAAKPSPSLPDYPQTIQHSATINHGNSGGPLLNDQGQVIGINTLTNAGDANQPVQGQYYAISINHVKPLLGQLEGGTSVHDIGADLDAIGNVPLSQVFPAVRFGTARLGQQTQEFAARNFPGLWVWGTDPGSAAEQAHLKFGDVLTDVNGTPVDSVGALCSVLESSTPGQVLRIHGRYVLSGGTSNFLHTWGDKLTAP